MSQKESKKSCKLFKKQNLIWVIVVIIFVTWIFSHFITNLFIDSEKLTDYGLFGDSFGAVNALFSGLALAGVIYAIFLQREDLKIQQKELQLSRKEFQINRINNNIYKQLEKLELYLSKVKTSTSGSTKFGADAYIELNDTIDVYLDHKRDYPSPNSQQLNVRTRYLDKIINGFIGYDKEQIRFLRSMKSTYNIIRDSFVNDDMNQNDKRELKRILELNLGSEIYSCIKKSIESFDDFFNLNSYSKGDETTNSRIKKIIPLYNIMEDIEQLRTIDSA